MSSPSKALDLGRNPNSTHSSTGFRVTMGLSWGAAAVGYRLCPRGFVAKYALGGNEIDMAPAARINGEVGGCRQSRETWHFNCKGLPASRLTRCLRGIVHACLLACVSKFRRAAGVGCHFHRIESSPRRVDRGSLLYEAPDPEFLPTRRSTRQPFRRAGRSEPAPETRGPKGKR